MHNADRIEEVNKKYPLNELIDYQKHIESLAITETIAEGKEVVFNDSVIHASLIMGSVLRHSKAVNMFCGKFSVFRKAFKEKIELMLSDSFYDGVRHTEEFENFRPFEKSEEALIDFFVGGGKMKVVLEDDPASLQEEPIWKELSKFVGEKKLLFYKRNEDAPKLSHFAIGDNRYYRWENNQKQRTALCSFYDTETVKTLSAGFDLIQSESTEYKFN